MPRTVSDSLSGVLFGGDSKAAILKVLSREDWIRETELAKKAKVDKKVVDVIVGKLSEKNPRAFEVSRPYKGVKLYRLRPGTKVADGLRLIFEQEGV
jgi:hypothetical protein